MSRRYQCDRSIHDPLLSLSSASQVAGRCPQKAVGRVAVETPQALRALQKVRLPVECSEI